MHEIKINYGSGRSLRRSLPSSWEEVPHLRRWDLLREVIAGKPALEILIRMLDLPSIILKSITEGQWHDLLRSMSWLYSQLPIERPVLHYICPRKVALYFPAEDFTNVTGREYALFDDMIMQDGQEDKILAVLCRPTNPTRPKSDKRIPLTSRDDIEAWLPEVQAIPQEIRTYLHAIFSGYRVKLYETYKDWIFTPPTRVTDDDQPESTSTLDFGWWGAFLSIAKDGVFGTYDEVLQTPIHNICMHMAKEAEEALRLQEHQDHALALARMKS